MVPARETTKIFFPEPIRTGIIGPPELGAGWLALPRAQSRIPEIVKKTEKRTRTF